jgi:hypothetical protein
MGVSVGNLHVDQALTNVSLMYRNAAMVADQVFPPLPVDKQSNKYYVYGMDNLRPDDDERRPGGLANEIDWNVSANPYYCDGHALSQVIPDEWRENADQALNLDTDTTIQLTDKILLNREVALAAVIAGLTPHAQTAARWDVDTTDPVKVIDAAKEVVAAGIGLLPNSLLLPRPVFRGIRNNLLVKNRISGAQNFDASRITAQQLAAVLEVDNLIVADAIKVTSAEGQTVTTEYVWGKTALLFYRPPAPGLRTMALGYQFTWNTGRLGSLIYTGRADKRHADWIEAMKYYDLRTTAAGAGYYFTDCVS